MDNVRTIKSLLSAEQTVAKFTFNLVRPGLLSHNVDVADMSCRSLCKLAYSAQSEGLEAQSWEWFTA